MWKKERECENSLSKGRGRKARAIQERIFTFQATRLHERHLPEHRLQGVSRLSHTIWGGTRERGGKQRTWDGPSIRELRSAIAVRLSSCFPGHFSAVKMHRATRNVAYLAVVSRYLRLRFSVIFTPFVAYYSHGCTHRGFLQAPPILISR